MKKCIVGLGCFVLMILLSSSFSFAQVKLNPQMKVKKPMQMALKTDLVVEAIYGQSCPCKNDVEAANVILYKDLWVTVGNWNCQGGGTTKVSFTLKVTYFDLKTRSNKVKNIPITMNANSRKAIKIWNGRLAVNKSPVGVTAEITNISRNVKDCNLANNKKRVISCQIPPVY